MRSGVGAAWPFTFLVLFLVELFRDLELLEVEECFVVLLVEVFLGGGLCTPAAGTVHVPAANAARIIAPRLRLQSR